MQAFVFVVIFGRLVQKLFLGQLRAIETEVGDLKTGIAFHRVISASICTIVHGSQ
jgi:hypothetical protein